MNVASPIARDSGFVSFTNNPSQGLLKGFALLMLLVSGLVDLPRELQIGPVTSQGVLTIIYFFGALLLWPTVPGTGSRISSEVVPFAIFWTWATLSLAWTTALFEGVQNVLVIGTTLVVLLLTRSAASGDLTFAFWLEKQVWRSVLIAVVPYTLAAMWFGAGTDELLSARSFGLFAVFGVAYQLSRWRYGSWSALVWAIAITGLIGVSLSRLALGSAVILFPLSQVPTRRAARAVRMVVVTAAVTAASYGAFLYFDSLRDRFLSGDVSMRIGSYAINGNGRMAFWRVTMQSFEDSPLIGKGAGTASELIGKYWSYIEHPHSDYLRVLHDYGLVGLVLWVASLITLLVALWRYVRRSEGARRPAARLQMTAFLTLVAFAIQMTAENALVYLFMAAPLGLIIGAALGAHRTPLRARSSEVW